MCFVQYKNVGHNNDTSLITVVIPHAIWTGSDSKYKVVVKVHPYNVEGADCTAFSVA